MIPYGKQDINQALHLACLEIGLKKDGKTTWWHENGQIKSERNYKDGVYIGGDC